MPNINNSVIITTINSRGIMPTTDELLEYRTEMTKLLLETEDDKKKFVLNEIKAVDHIISNKSS